MCVPTLQYRPSELFKYKRGSGYPPSDVIERLKDLKLFHSRGSRGGRGSVRSIPVHTSARKEPREKSVRGYKHIEVPRSWYSLPSLLLSNVTSLANKVDELIVTVREASADIVAITEAWQIVPEVCGIDNYQLFHHLRTGRRGGGVALYCRSSLCPSLLSVDVPDGVEALWVRVTSPSHPRNTASIIVCVVYHPPRASTAQVLADHLITTADRLRVRFPAAKLVICGDFNRLDTSDIQHQLRLTQVVGFPSHEQATLDLILSDLSHQYQPPLPLPPIGRSNHLSIIWRPAPTTSVPKSSVTRTHRPMPDSAVRDFGQWVTHHPWTEVTGAEDVNIKWGNYVTTTMQAYHHYFPVRKVTVHPSDAPWMSPRIKRLLRQRNRLYYTDPARYRGVRNRVIREIKIEKRRYYPDKIKHLKQANSSQWFYKVKLLCGLQKQSPTLPCTSHLPSNEAAEEINGHFAAICQTLPPLCFASLPAYLPPPSTPHIVQEADVVKRIKKFKSNRATTPCDLPIKIYKEFALELATPLTSIINASLSQSSVPADWKTSYVTPLPKTPSPQSFNDLRPVAITPIPSLICEDFVFDWSYSKIIKHIDPQQFGNIKATSTTHYLVNFLEFIHSNLDKRDTSLALAFVDFRKAFDLVDHTVVITKAIKLGLHPDLISWLADFLSGRQQAVRYQGSVSSLRQLTCGVPQGTKMGPLCFLIMINDALTDTIHRWKYVDDCTLGITVNNRAPNYTSLQDSLDKLQAWTQSNSVTINHTKTVVMHVCTAKTAVPPPQLSIGPHSLQVVNTFKLLGVGLDDHLSWSQHVASVVKAASYRLFMLRRLKSLGTQAEELKGVYISFILPKLMYASPAWSSSLNSTQLHQLERVQKRACRVILGPAYVDYAHALTTLSLTTLAARYERALSSFGRGLLRTSRHRHFLPPAAPPPSRTTRNPNVLVPPKAPRTDRYKRSAIPTIIKGINLH